MSDGTIQNRGALASRLVDRCQELERECHRYRAHVAALVDEITTLVCESNGLADNEWKTRDGVVVAEWPCQSLVDSIDRLSKLCDAPDLAALVAREKWIKELIGAVRNQNWQRAMEAERALDAAEGKP